MLGPPATVFLVLHYLQVTLTLRGTSNTKPHPFLLPPPYSFVALPKVCNFASITIGFPRSTLYHIPAHTIGTTRSGKEMPTPRSSLNGMAGLKTTHPPHPRWMTPKCGLAVQSYFPHCLSRNQSRKMRTYCAGIIHIYSRPCHLVLGAICSK